MHELTTAILIYEAPNSRLGLDQERPIVVHHRATTQAGGIQLGSPAIITESFLENLRKQTGHRAPLSLLRPRIIAISGEHDQIAWCRDAGPATLFFDTNDAALDAQSGKSFPLPRLVFRASRAHSGWNLSIAAIHNNEPLTMKTPIGCAPFYNVYDDGRVCLGSTTPTPHTTPLDELPELLERHFFSSAFTHPSNTRTHAFKGSYAELLAQARKTKRFNPAWIATTRHSLETFLRAR